MTINSFKVFCLPLSKSKRDTLNEMIREYSNFYNVASKIIPSLNGSKHLRNAYPSILYKKLIGSKQIERNYIGALEANYAIGDAVANFKSHGNTSQINTPNIIKFDKDRYEIIKLNDNYGIQIGTRKNGIYLPIITGDYEKLTNFLDSIIKSGENPGTILYNFEDNSISISHDISKEYHIPKYKTDIEVDTLIGVDLGSNNLAAISVISFKKEDVAPKIIELKKLGEKYLVRNDVNVKINEVKLISGLGNKFRMKKLKKVENMRRSVRKDVGHKRQNIQEYNAHYISAKVAEIAKKYPNSLVVLEANLTNVRTKYSLWTPGNVKSKIEYKLNNIGIRTKEVFAGYTSQRCNKCGAIGNRQKGTVYFSCPSCGLGGSNPSSTVGQYNADVNAAINIALKGLFSLYGKKKRSVDRALNVYPNEHTREGEPKPKNEVCNGKNSCKDMIPNNEINESNSLVRRQSNALVGVVDCVPENNQLSYPYKGFDKNPIRTKSEEKIAMRSIVLKSEF